MCIRDSLLPGTRELAEQGVVPGGTRLNFDAAQPHVQWHPEITIEEQLILCDAQTSGGLLIAIPSGHVRALIEALDSRGVPHSKIGAVIDRRADGRLVEARP